MPNPEKLLGQGPQAPQATPNEKMKGMIGLGKLQIDQMKAKALVAVQLTQALLNMVEASGGMLDNRAALLQMAQIEQTVQELMAGANNANGILDGMAQQPGDAGAGNVPQVPAGGANGSVPPGAGSAPGSSRADGGVA